MIPEYSHVQQTVSEIGEAGSPARIPFTVMLCCVAPWLECCCFSGNGGAPSWTLDESELQRWANQRKAAAV
jgi:hypothetical protein